MSDITCAPPGREARDLGMERPLSRRDFLDGIAMTAGLAAFGVPDGGAIKSPGQQITAFAPHLTGLRGDSSPALSVPHALRDGRFWQHAGTPVPTGEVYDLVVVGGGASGVSAAREWLSAYPGASVLILDNRDELGGRERAGGPLTGGYDSVMCDRETFATERLIRRSRAVAQWVDRLPMAERARRDLLRLYRDPPDWFAGLAPRAKRERLAGMTYSGFLLEVCRAHPDVERFCRTMSSSEWARGAPALTALDAMSGARGWAYPGFGGLGLERSGSPRVGPEHSGSLSVRAVVAGLIPGAGCQGGLDRPGSRIRLRLSSPVVSVRNDGPPESATGATVGYFDGHRVRTVRAGSVILACWQLVIPYLMPDLPADQRAALREAVRLPLVEAVVRLRDQRAWRRTGVTATRWTGAYWCLTELTGPSGAGRNTRNHGDDHGRDRERGHDGDGRGSGDRDGGGWDGGNEDGGFWDGDRDGPVEVRLVAAPCRSELGAAAGAAAGRRALMRTPYSTLEYGIRDQLTRLLGSGGFDPARDIEAITVYRWGHGHPAGHLEHGSHLPSSAEVARRRFGRVAIAGSDSAAVFPASVVAARRAVRELSA